MAQSQASARDTRPGQRRTLLLIAALFFAPVAIAFFFYYGTEWKPGATVNHGELVTPARAVPATALRQSDGKELSSDFLRGKWSLVYVGAGACDEPCRKALYAMRQVRLALNQDMDRVQRVFLYTGECCEQPFFGTEHPGLIEASTDSEAGHRIESVFAGPASSNDSPHAGHIYVVDPLGNLMMSYPPGADPKGLLADLKRLLKLSHVG